MVSYANLDVFLTDTCGASGVTTDACDVSATTLYPAFDIYGLSTAILADAFDNNCSCPAFPLINVRLNCLEERLGILTLSVNEVIAQLDEGLNVTVTIPEIVVNTTTASSDIPVVEYPLCPVAA